MGNEDMRRQRPNVERMRLLGAEVAAVDAGAQTLEEAVSEAIRDWVASSETTHYLIGSSVGPAPLPLWCVTCNGSSATRPARSS